MIIDVVEMKKIKVLFFMLYFCFSVCMFPLSFFTRIIDGDRRITKEEQQIIYSLLDEYHKRLWKQVYPNIEELFHEKKIKISIEYNASLTKYDSDKEYMGEIISTTTFDSIFHNYLKYAGNFETMKIKSIVFSKQPYDYPIGNIFYLVLETKYNNLNTKEIMYISKDSGKIYEHIIYIPKS